MKLLVQRLLAAAVLVGSEGIGHSENVDLSTVPRRDTVQLTIYNSEDLTLVRETRVVTFKQGINPLQFSWANTLIDPSSVELKFLTSADNLEVLDTTFPHDKPADPQLHRQAHRRRNPTPVRGTHRIPQPAPTEAARLPDGRDENTGGERRP